MAVLACPVKEVSMEERLFRRLLDLLEIVEVARDFRAQPYS
jgi:hypothetical protein